MDPIDALNSYMQALYTLKEKTTNNIEKRALWLHLYKEFTIDNSISTAMILIHPDFPDVEEETRVGFKKKISIKCELGKLVIGAKCPNIAVELDHMWPISLGGVTDDRNRADLCKDCNRGKSNTIVGYFPWGETAPNWVIEKVQTIRRLIGE